MSSKVLCPSLIFLILMILFSSINSASKKNIKGSQEASDSGTSFDSGRIAGRR